MGIKSIITTDRLYWLGRYSERVYTTLRLFAHSFDKLIDHHSGDYTAFCASLEISDIYKDKKDFIIRYPFDLDNPDSIASNLQRAYDNAIELREEIGSECLSFIQMAIYEMDSARRSDAPLLYFQKISDVLLAFWGCVDDQIDDENTRNILKVGKRVERLDLFARLRMERPAIEREVNRLSSRIGRSFLMYNQKKITHLKELVAAPELDYPAIISTVEQVLV